MIKIDFYHRVFRENRKLEAENSKLGTRHLPIFINFNYVDKDRNWV